METFLEILREVLKGIVREISGHFFSEKRFRTQEIHPTPSQAKGWISKIITIFDNHHPDGRGCGREVLQYFSLFIIFPLYNRNKVSGNDKRQNCRFVRVEIQSIE
jgi:hypothetical protein